MKWIWNWSELKTSVFDHQNHRCLSASLFPCCPSHSMLVFLFCFFLTLILECSFAFPEHHHFISTSFLAWVSFCHPVVQFSWWGPFHHFNHHPLKREKVGDVNDHQDHGFDGYSKLLVSRCLLVLFNLNVCSCVQFSEALHSGKLQCAHTCVFIARQLACNGECQIMGIASLLKGLGVVFEQHLWVNVDEKSQNSNKRMSLFMHTLYLNIDYI